MELTHPERLLGAALLLLLWWLARPPRPRRVVLTAHFGAWRRALASVPRRRLRFRHLRFWLLALAALLAVSASGEPIVGRRDGPARLVVVLDGSDSMAARLPGGGTAWEAALARTRAAVEGLPGEVAVEVLIAAHTVSVLGGAREAVLGRLPAEPPGGGDLDLARIAAAAAARADTAVLTVTDGYTAHLPAVGALALIGPPAAENAGIVACTVEDAWPTPDVRVRCSVAGAGADDRPVLRVSGGAELVEASVEGVSMAAGAPAVDLVLDLRRTTGGRVELLLDAGGAVAGDDRVALELARPAGRIGLLEHGDRPDWFLAQAAAWLAELAGGEPIAATPGTEVDFLLVGGGRLAAVPERSATFGTAFSAEPMPPAEEAVRDWDRQHPWTRGLDFSEVVVERTVPPEGLPAGRPLLFGERGPLAVAVGAEGRASLHTAFRLDAGGLPLASAFPLLLRRAWAAAHGDFTARHGGVTDPGEVVLRRPEGAAERPLPPFADRGRRLAAAFLVLAALLIAIRVWA